VKAFFAYTPAHRDTFVMIAFQAYICISISIVEEIDQNDKLRVSSFSASQMLLFNQI
jgi:hypothetical protein